jgi:hypothetical protein
MSIESAIEETIREAMARGEFDDLPGAGKPLDLTAYFDTPEELRMAFALLRSNEFVPSEIELLKEIEELRTEIRSSNDESEKAALTRKLNERLLAYNIAVEKYRKK